MANTLFRPKPEQEKRKVQILVRCTQEEATQVRHGAAVRKMDVAEFVRRAALGRRADVDHQTEIVLALSSITREIRALHAAMVEHGVSPPEEALLPLILEARKAIMKVSDPRGATAVGKG